MLVIVLLPIVLIMMVLNIDVGNAAYEIWFDNDGDDGGKEAAITSVPGEITEWRKSMHCLGQLGFQVSVFLAHRLSVFLPHHFCICVLQTLYF